MVIWMDFESWILETTVHCLTVVSRSFACKLHIFYSFFRSQRFHWESKPWIPEAIYPNIWNLAWPNWTRQLGGWNDQLLQERTVKGLLRTSKTCPRRLHIFRSPRNSSDPVFVDHRDFHQRFCLWRCPKKDCTPANLHLSLHPLLVACLGYPRVEWGTCCIPTRPSSLHWTYPATWDWTSGILLLKEINTILICNLIVKYWFFLILIEMIQ